MRRIAIIVAPVCLAAVAALIWWLSARSASSAETALVRRGSIQSTVNALGQIAPRRQASLSTRTNGAVRAVHVTAGEQVRAGQVLLDLDDSEVQAALTDAQRNLAYRQQLLDEALLAPDSASIAVARARLRRATVAKQQAQDDYDAKANDPEADRDQEALDLETAHVELEVAQADFERVMAGTTEADRTRLRADVDAAQRAVVAVQVRLGYTQIVAPFAGTVLRVQASEGENVGGYTPLIVLADLDTLEIHAEIDELDVAQVAVGQVARVTLDAFPAQEITATLQQVMPGPSEARGATTYQAIIMLGETGLALRTGMGANVTIITATEGETLLIPRRAVRQVGHYQVVRLQEGRRVREVVITTGLSNEADIQVLDGLQEGQTVLLD